uniref:MI domain-containing protein n=1 Tax=Rhabditophanes sp. KR3021 TaxID=114890 RepID=A0AC35TGZ4_9BILA
MDLEKLRNTRSSRKDNRKDAKNIKKLAKTAHYQKRKLADVIQEKFESEAPASKKKKRNRRSKAKKATQTSEIEKRHQQLTRDPQSELDTDEELTPEEEEERLEALKKCQNREDEEIAYYGKLLGLNKRKGKKAEMLGGDDCLDYLLEIFNEGNRDKVKATEEKEAELMLKEKNSDDNDQDDDDLLDDIMVVDKENDEDLLDEENDWLDEEMEENLLDEELEDEELEGEELEGEELEDEELEDEELEGEELEDEELEDEELEDEELENDNYAVTKVAKRELSNKNEICLMSEDDEVNESDFDEPFSDFGDEKEDLPAEDIYGREIDTKTGKVLDKESRLRQKIAQLDENAEPSSKEDQIKLEKTIRAVMNRLSEASLGNAIKTIHESWESHSHNEVKKLIYELLMKAIDVDFKLGDKMLLEYAALFCVIHGVVSSEVTFYIVEHLICDFVARAQESTLSVKKLQNLGCFVANLYNFKLLKTSFVLNLIELISPKLDMDKLELLKAIYRTIGNSLKKRDAVVFEEHLAKIKQNLPLLAELGEDNFKYKFLVEEFSELKVVNLNKLTASFDETQMLHMIKVIQGLVKKSTNKEGELGMTVSDLLNASTHGRWWTVGSAWKPSEDSGLNIASTSKKDSTFDPSLLALAKKAKMNMEHRKNIFCTIMGAIDELDVFQKLMKLGLKEVHERDIIHVAVVCCGLERTYNPFYSNLIAQFCSFNNRFKLTTQYALWDRIKALQTLKKNKLTNFSYLVADLLKKEAVQLGVLKIMDLASLSKNASSCLKMILDRLFESTSESKLREIFDKVVSTEKLQTFSQGLQLFIELNFEGNEEEKSLDKVSKLLNLFRENYAI